MLAEKYNRTTNEVYLVMPEYWSAENYNSALYNQLVESKNFTLLSHSGREARSTIDKTGQDHNFEMKISYPQLWAALIAKPWNNAMGLQ